MMRALFPLLLVVAAAYLLTRSARQPDQLPTVLGRVTA